MFHVTVYDCHKPWHIVDHRVVFAADRLTPAMARDLMRIYAINTGMVLQEDEITLKDGRIGSIAYRVFPSGRVRRIVYTWNMTAAASDDDRPF